MSRLIVIWGVVGLAVGPTLGATVPANAGRVPRIFWASDPVRPNETVMLHGSDLGASAAVIEMARLDDGDAKSSSGKNLTTPAIANWTRVAVLQGSDETLKFIVPAEWKPGVFACRITSNEATSEPAFINAPDPWWIQGDEGDAATPGGWMRVMGKSLLIGAHAAARLEPEKGAATLLEPVQADEFCLRFQIPHELALGRYTVRVHNGAGGDAAWRVAGEMRIQPSLPLPTASFSVLDACGPDAAKQMRESLIKYNQPVDRTDGILAALKKAKENGGGIVYFPAGRYRMRGPLVVPDHTVLKGEAMGLVTLWWGGGHFNLDGGDERGRARPDDPKPPHNLIEGSDFGMEDMSLFLPLDYEQGIVSERRLRLSRLRIRIDHYWLVQGRGGGTVARLGGNAQVTDCDILAKGDGLVAGQYAMIAHNRISANKSNTPMGGSQDAIVEDNQFVSMDPTAYQNISSTGRNIYYAHNHHEALYAQQSDYSFTFDAGSGPYTGKIASADGVHVTLAADPVFPKWANEQSNTWKRACLCILDGRGAGQWRDVITHRGRAWEIDRPFDTPPDATSVASIVTFNGRVLIIRNHFEDSNWVNAGYGTSIDVVCAGNTLLRCADLMNHGVGGAGAHGCEPSWHVQYFDNEVTQGRTRVSFAAGRPSPEYSGPLTRWCIHRRQDIAADNSGGISINGNVRDAIVEGCTLHNAFSTIKADGAATGVTFRNNVFLSDGAPSPRYEGDGLKNAVVSPVSAAKAKP